MIKVIISITVAGVTIVLELWINVFEEISVSPSCRAHGTSALGSSPVLGEAVKVGTKLRGIWMQSLWCYKFNFQFLSTNRQIAGIRTQAGWHYLIPTLALPSAPGQSVGHQLPWKEDICEIWSKRVSGKQIPAKKRIIALLEKKDTCTNYETTEKDGCDGECCSPPTWGGRRGRALQVQLWSSGTLEP